ncbi:MAG: hypothetical protein WBB98_15230 [Xanthobacteraceae bacterium]
MAQQTINIGTAPNDGTGDSIRDAFGKVNDNTTETYAAVASNAAALAGKAPLASPALTGTPTAPTAAASTNTTQIATTAMVQAALAAYIAAQDVLVFKGAIDCSANPNYPAADAGHVYRVSVAGKIGGSSGKNVEAGDVLTCITDSSSAGTQAAVGANWIITQVNLDGAVIGPASATDARIAVFDGTTGKLLKDGGSTIADIVSGASDVAATIHAAAAKATPADADEFGIVDSADSDALKNLTWGGIKTALGAIFQAIPGALSAWVPTISTNSGTLGTVGTVTARYLQVGKLVFFSIKVPLVLGSSSPGGLNFTLPVTASASASAAWSGIEAAVTGKMCVGFLNTTTQGRILFYDGTSPIATGALVACSGFYEAA